MMHLKVSRAVSTLGSQTEFNMVIIQAVMCCDSRGYVAIILFSI